MRGQNSWDLWVERGEEPGKHPLGVSSSAHLILSSHTAGLGETKRSFSSQNEDPLSRQRCDERSDAWIVEGKAQGGGSYGRDAERKQGSGASCLLRLGEKHPEASHTVTERARSTHFGRIVVMQESRVLPQNKAPHLPVFPLVTLRQRKDSRLIYDSSYSLPPTSWHRMPNLQASLSTGTPL